MFTFGIGKGMNPLILSSYGLKNSTIAILQGWIWHYITHKIWQAIKQKRQTKHTEPNYELIALPLLFYKHGFDIE